MMRIARAAEIFATGVVAGSFYIGTVAIHPAADQLDGPAHLLLRQELIRRLRRALPPFMLLPLAAVIGALAFCHVSVLRPLDVLGCALSLATIAITMAVNAPLNRRFASWSPKALPSDWQKLIRRWNIAHSSRMATAVGAFLCAILAVS